MSLSSSTDATSIIRLSHGDRRQPNFVQPAPASGASQATITFILGEQPLHQRRSCRSHRPQRISITVARVQPPPHAQITSFGMFRRTVISAAEDYRASAAAIFLRYRLSLVQQIIMSTIITMSDSIHLRSYVAVSF